MREKIKKKEKTRAGLRMSKNCCNFAPDFVQREIEQRNRNECDRILGGWIGCVDHDGDGVGDVQCAAVHAYPFGCGVSECGRNPVRDRCVGRQRDLVGYQSDVRSGGRCTVCGDRRFDAHGCAAMDREAPVRYAQELLEIGASIDAAGSGAEFVFE